MVEPDQDREIYLGMAAALAELECEHDSGIVDELVVCSSYGPAISLA